MAFKTIQKQQQNKIYQQYLILLMQTKQRQSKYTKQVTQLIVDNVWNQQTDNCSKCICPEAPSNLSENKRIDKCYRCNQQYHSDCFWPRQKDSMFECPFCFLSSCRPEKAVKAVIFAGYLPFIKKEKVEYKINFQLPEQQRKNKNQFLEIRCVKFNSKNRFEISWPDIGSIMVNKCKLFDFTPLSCNSPLKRRNDDSIRLNQIKDGNYQITIQEKTCSDSAYKVNKRCHHLVMVFLLTDVSQQVLFEKFKQNQQDMEKSKETIQRQLQQDIDGLTIQKLLIPLKCHYYGDTIKIPARSVMCNHFQPFDLKSMVISSIQAKGNIRAWKCPICDKRAYNLIVDNYLLSIIKSHKNPKEIIFKKDAEPQAHEMKQSNDEEINDEKVLDCNINVQPKVLKCEKIIEIQQSSSEEFSRISQSLNQSNKQSEVHENIEHPQSAEIINIDTSSSSQQIEVDQVEEFQQISEIDEEINSISDISEKNPEKGENKQIEENKENVKQRVQISENHKNMPIFIDLLSAHSDKIQCENQDIKKNIQIKDNMHEIKNDLMEKKHNLMDFKEALDGYRDKVIERRKKKSEPNFLPCKKTQFQEQHYNDSNNKNEKLQTLKKAQQDNNNRIINLQQNSIQQFDYFSNRVQDLIDEQRHNLVLRVLQAHESLRVQNKSKIGWQQVKAFDKIFQRLTGNCKH